jgi:Mrp family chromosome partitioning ATPase
VLVTALKRLKSTENPVAFGLRVASQANSDTRLLKITVNAAKPDRAAHEANVLADELVRVGRAQRPVIAAATADASKTAPAKINPAQAAAAVDLRVIESATPPPSAKASSSKTYVGVAALAGILFALVIGVVVDAMRRRIETPREMDAASRAPAIGRLGGEPAVAPATAALARARDGLVVAGAADGGAAPLALGMARALSRDGLRVLLIDADPTGELSRELGLGERRGLFDALSAGDGAGDLEPVPTGPDGRILVLPRGASWGRSSRGAEPTATPLVDRDAARRALAPVERRADVIVICAGAAPAVSGLGMWAPTLPGAVVAVPRGEVSPSELTEAVAILERHGFDVRGSVLVTGRGGIFSRLTGRREASPPAPRRRAGTAADEASHQPA